MSKSYALVLKVLRSDHKPAQTPSGILSTSSVTERLELEGQMVLGLAYCC